MNIDKIYKENYKKWYSKEHIFEKKNGVYEALTYGEFLDTACGMAKYFFSKGLKNKKIILYGNNSCDLMLADFAIQNYVGVSVWVAKEWQEKELKQAIEKLDIECIIYGDEKRDIVETIKKEYPDLIFMPACDIKNNIEKSKLNDDLEITDENECCKIVFSSGTTSFPKAIMLSKKNIFSGTEGLFKRCPFDENDIAYLFLPLSHTYGNIYNFIYSFVFGFSVYLCSDMSVMAQEIQEVQPTIFSGVPAVYRRFYEGYGEHVGVAFGPHIKYLFCGGARMDENIVNAYKNSGLRFLNAYALSETASTFAIQYQNDDDNECVGTVAENIDVKILDADDNGTGEVAVKGDNVFLGYAGDEELTRNSFTEDGYFKTNDLGYLKPDEKNGGYKLYILGRMGSTLIGENGENIEPKHIEQLICDKNENISKAVLYIHDGKIACKLFLHQICEYDWQQFFDEINSQLLKYERIKHFEIEMAGNDNSWKEA